MKDKIIEIQKNWVAENPDTIPGAYITLEVVKAAQADGYVVTSVQSAPSFVMGFFTGLVFAYKHGIPLWVKQLQKDDWK